HISAGYIDAAMETSVIRKKAQDYVAGCPIKDLDMRSAARSWGSNDVRERVPSDVGRGHTHTTAERRIICVEIKGRRRDIQLGIKRRDERTATRIGPVNSQVRTADTNC